MPRLKTLGLLAGLIAALALSATPASAWFQSMAKPVQTRGNIEALTEGEFKYGGAATVRCIPSTIKATWQIQTKGQIKHHGQEVGKQEATTFGPHLLIQVKNWGTCEAKIGNGAKIVATVEPCNLQQVQQKGSLTATGGVVTECVIKAGTCEIHVPPGMETQPGSGVGINVGLEEISLTNSGSNLLEKITINKGGLGQQGVGILAFRTPGGTCTLVKHTEAGTLEGLELKALELNEV